MTVASYRRFGCELAAVNNSTWDGLSGYYRNLWEMAGMPLNEAHPAWLKALS
jgi:hypothetical protein